MANTNKTLVNTNTQLKTGIIDTRVQADDILELRETGRPTEYLKVIAVTGNNVKFIDMKNLRAKPEIWEMEDLINFGVIYSARSAESLAPRKARHIEMTDSEFAAVREMLKTIRKANK